jgi:hypothetical protein
MVRVAVLGFSAVATALPPPPVPPPPPHAARIAAKQVIATHLKGLFFTMFYLTL